VLDIIKNFSPQQKAFVQEAMNGSSSIVLIAVAGAGKTTCIRAAAKLIGGSSLILAYNRKIAIEIKEKLLADGVDWKKAEATTVHAIGLRNYKKTFKAAQVDEHKMSKIVEQWLLFDQIGSDLAPYTDIMLQLVSLAKQRAMGVIESIDSVDSWMDIINHFDLLDNAPEGAANNCFAIIEIAQKLLKRSIKMTEEIDFDDMIYMPLMHPVRFWQYDNVFVDEAQDTNAARRELVKRLVKLNGKVIAVGDPRQAIYGFTGADADSLDLIKRDFKAIEMPLTITYRCPKKVVQYAKMWVNHIEAADTAPEGNVTASTFEQMAARADLDNNSAILCRNTKPLVQAAFNLIRRNIACKVEGRDIGGGLKKLATRWKSIKTITALENKLEEYKAKEIEKAKAKKNERKVQEIEDRIDTLKVFMDRCREEGKHDVTDVVKCIDGVFGDNVSDCLVLSTIHKSKGREWRRVYWLDRQNTCPSRAAKQPWEIGQEFNLCYVAATRAMEELVELSPPLPATAKPPAAANANESRLIPKTVAA
jgi:DNA helicase-2/ATP-dependent DNA helicase PcrA